jgi:hypothetical protein
MIQFNTLLCPLVSAVKCCLLSNFLKWRDSCIVLTLLGNMCDCEPPGMYVCPVLCYGCFSAPTPTPIMMMCLCLSTQTLRHDAMKAYGGMDFLDLGISCRWVVTFKPRLIYPRLYLDRRLGEPQNRYGQHVKKIVTPSTRTPTPRLSNP